MTLIERRPHPNPTTRQPRSARLKPRPTSNGRWYGLCEDCGWDTRTTMHPFTTAGTVGSVAAQHGGIDPLTSGSIICPNAIRCG